VAPNGRKRLAPYGRKRVAPYRRKRLAPYAENGWTTIGRELTRGTHVHHRDPPDSVASSTSVFQNL